MNTTAKIESLAAGTLILNPADGTVYRRTGDLEWHDGDAANWRVSDTRGASGTVSNAELRLLQIELNNGRAKIIWQP